MWHRVDSILENSDSVLILGKDDSAAFDRLKRIASKLAELGYYTYIVKEQSDRLGESVATEGDALRAFIQVRGYRATNVSALRNDHSLSTRARPNHSWTSTISALCKSALVTTVACSE